MRDCCADAGALRSRCRPGGECEHCSPERRASRGDAPPARAAGRRDGRADAVDPAVSRRRLLLQGLSARSGGPRPCNALGTVGAMNDESSEHGGEFDRSAPERDNKTCPLPRKATNRDNVYPPVYTAASFLGIFTLYCQPPGEGTLSILRSAARYGTAQRHDVRSECNHTASKPAIHRGLRGRRFRTRPDSPGLDSAARACGIRGRGRGRWAPHKTRRREPSTFNAGPFSIKSMVYPGDTPNGILYPLGLSVYADGVEIPLRFYQSRPFIPSLFDSSFIFGFFILFYSWAR